jgi:hypothetical protein
MQESQTFELTQISIIGSSMPSELSAGGISFSSARSDEVRSLCANNNPKLRKSAEDLARGILYTILWLLSRVNSILNKCTNGFAFACFDRSQPGIT